MKRACNTLAARNSRRRKMRQFDELEEQIAKLEKERDQWKALSLTRQQDTTAHAIPVEAAASVSARDTKEVGADELREPFGEDIVDITNDHRMLD
jgi:hypothetical protein